MTLRAPAFAAVAVITLALGVLLVLPVCGADVPIVISLLNAFTGLTVAASGYVLTNTLLLVAGTLVERLPLLAGPRLRSGRPFSRGNRGYPGDLVGHRLCGGVDVPLRGGCGGRHAGGSGRPRRERERMIGA